MRYAVAALALLGASAPAMAVQAIHVSGSVWFKGTGIRQEVDAPPHFRPIIGIVTFDFTINVDNSLNGEEWDELTGYLSSTNASYTFAPLGSWYTETVNVSFAPFDFVDAAPGKLITSGHASAGYTPFQCHGNECFEIEYADIAHFNGTHVTIEGLADPVPVPTGSASFTWHQLPEPATWAMMLIGFGMIGAALRGGRARLIA